MPKMAYTVEYSFQEGTMNKKIVKIAGIVAIVGGSAALYLAGTNEGTVSAIVAAVFVLAGVIAAVFKVEL